MPVPTYGGLAIFGPTAFVAVAPEPRARQINSYAGVNGVESLDQGSRGASATVAGIWFCGSGLELVTLLQTWIGLMDGVPRTLVDSKGIAWDGAILEPFQLPVACSTSAATGSVIQPFSGRLSILTLAVGYGGEGSGGGPAEASGYFAGDYFGAVGWLG